MVPSQRDRLASDTRGGMDTAEGQGPQMAHGQGTIIPEYYKITLDAFYENIPRWRRFWYWLRNSRDFVEVDIITKETTITVQWSYRGLGVAKEFSSVMHNDLLEIKTFSLEDSLKVVYKLDYLRPEDDE